MTRRQFSARLHARGPVLDLWPDAERNAALRLLDRSARARRLLADAAAVVDDMPLPGKDPALAARLRAGLWQGLAARAPTTPAPRTGPALLLRCGALAALFLLGAWVGLAAIPASQPATPDLFTSAQTPVWAETLR